jgi:hypothetical protein
MSVNADGLEADASNGYLWYNGIGRAPRDIGRRARFGGLPGIQGDGARQVKELRVWTSSLAPLLRVTGR